MIAIPEPPGTSLALACTPPDTPMQSQHYSHAHITIIIY